jgi:aspartate ammonia-lyase
LIPVYPRIGEIGRTRTEHDAQGPIDVPFDALYGAETERTRRNASISGVSIGQLPDLIHAFALVKKAAARANSRLQRLSGEKTAIIERVCDELMAGQHRQHFPVDVFQAGDGTATNTNMNEVIANRGLELMGRPCGDYDRLHPHDDINRSQSAADVYPIAVRLALMLSFPGLMDELSALADILSRGSTIREDVERLEAAVALLSGVATTEEFYDEVLRELSHLSRLTLTPVAGCDASVFVHLSGVLKGVASKLSGISNDLKMPPAVANVLGQVALHVIGTDVVMSFAAETDRRNAFTPVMVFGLLKSVMLLRNATLALHSHCVVRMN